MSGTERAEVRKVNHSQRADSHPEDINHQYPSGLLALQRTAGNAAVCWLLDRRVTAEQQQTGGTRMPVQRQGEDDGNEGGGDSGERRRQSRPRNAPRGTRPIDQSGLDRETIHGIKDGIGAGPRDWVGITPDGEIITTDAEGNAENNGHISDYARRGSENVPKWVWGLIGFAAMIGLIVLFATGVGELGLILAGAGTAIIFVVRSALRAAGRTPGPIASNQREGSDDQESAAV
jgi:hypothetical protein